MTAHNDVTTLQRRLNTLIHAATRIRQHTPDLHSLGYERTVTDTEKVAGGQPDRTPKSGDPRARRLYERIFAEVASIEAELVGLDRMMIAVFTAGAERPNSTRGSTISVTEFDRLRANQRKRPDTPARLGPQPQHPGRRR